MPRLENLSYALAALSLIQLLPAPTPATAQDETFLGWLRAFRGTYVLEVHGTIPAESFEFPEIPLCPVGRCGDMFVGGGSYRLSMDLEVNPFNQPTAVTGTRLTTTLVRVNVVTGERTVLGRLSKKVRNFEASRSRDLDIPGFGADEQMLAIVTFKRGTIFAGNIVDLDLSLALN